MRQELLEASDHTTGCAYKGRANYYSLKVGGELYENIAWYYRFPTTETSKIAGRIAFYDERVDAVIVDDVEMPRPVTFWSKTAKTRRPPIQQFSAPLTRKSKSN